ncbi:1 [Hexamita inflata]|uniref:1 n=1 Tax=Hexamita inflata TaxID=28002 RepID=A0AA86R8X1_9EUKA|nr:1 [Hexamita inflata] [Hexamita inflata]
MLLALIMHHLCDEKPFLELFSRNSQIEDQNGNKVSLKGYNFFGFNTGSAVVHGLWDKRLEDLLDWTMSEGYNAIRLPFACDLALDLLNTRVGYIDYDLNPGLKGLTSSEMMDYFISAAAARGQVVLLDMHNLYMLGEIDPLWYDSNLTESKVIQGWKNMVKRYNQWNVVGVDIKNEPHDEVTWGTGNISSDFDLYCQRVGDIIHEINPKLLIFVEGIHKWINWDYSNWGESLQGVQEHPVQLKIPDKIVYSPHIYGKDAPMSEQSAHWDSRFGYIVKNKLGPAVVIGEWGGDVYEPKIDLPFLKAMAQWMIANNITDNFHWCLNPNSRNTKGLIADDWTTPVQPKLDIINPIIKNPYLFPHVATCSSLIPFMNEGKCIKQCSSGYYSIVSSVFTCQPACSLYFLNTTNGNAKQCVTQCPSIAPQKDGQQCVTKLQKSSKGIIIGIAIGVLLLTVLFIVITLYINKIYSSKKNISPTKSKQLKQKIKLSTNQFV